MSTPISRNAPCPCGSGKKYKKCCWGKDFQWVEDEHGNPSRVVPMNDEMSDVMREHRKAWVAHHGREPGPDDLVFGDVDIEQANREVADAMRTVGVDPAFIYAFEKTGLIVTEDNERLIPDVQLAEYQAALDEFRAQEADGGAGPRFRVVGE